MDSEFSCVKNYNIAAKKRGDEITFLRRIVDGPADDSYGIEVAKLAGVPDDTIRRAKQILEQIEMRLPSRENRPQARVTPGIAATDELKSAVLAVNVETLTPIEAMNRLYELKRLAQNSEES